ncbi:hemolysin D [Afipia sp. Root123D2]|uniref:HlyD family secretion protein n=1 Tax=Afipia sp. Root123D2 TaxID=1736436 RepID=UPI0007006483|nr:HlyD family secretion protein [Afipia sp. Root123D2]KQW18283.1 hemolysin D [Afipia sp. Root123D2]
MSEMPRREYFEQDVVFTDESLPEETPPKPSQRLGRTVIKKGLFALAFLAGATALVGYGHHYWTTGRFIESTDDAYVKADYTTIAPKVPGYISEVLVQDNQRVAAGQVLARIDDRDFRAALAQARAEVGAATAAIDNLAAQIDLQQSLIAQAKAALDSSQASLAFADADATRYRDLMKTGSGTIQRAQQTESIRGQAAAQTQRDQAGLIAAQKKIAVLATEKEKAEAQLARSKALATQAELNLSYATITAPVNGTVGARSLRIGQFVNAGTQLMAVVPLHATYIVANFKETQLTYVRDGQPVEIRVDGFPDVTLTGRVDSVSPASGLEFALLPPDNATGNFTKIVQRIPVKITLDDSTLNGLLRAGMSVEPSVDTKAAVVEARRGQSLARDAATGTSPRDGHQAKAAPRAASTPAG